MNTDLHCEDVAVIYGQTEASPTITMHAPGDTPEQRSSTVGRAMPNTEFKLVNAEGATVALGVEGELCTRGYHIMAEYDQEPEATSHAIDADRWLHTGDLALMREDGHFHIRGRLKDMIIRGGENIYPAEIESFLFEHPKIAEAAVVGLPDLKMGEVVAAWIRPKTGEALTAEDVCDYLPGKHGTVQNPATYPDRRFLPNDGDRQSSEVSYPADGNRSARAGGADRGHGLSRGYSGRIAGKQEVGRIRIDKSLAPYRDCLG